jgi:hypothetical protein
MYVCVHVVCIGKDVRMCACMDVSMDVCMCVYACVRVDGCASMWM